jgi:hypothetical protein
LNADLQKIRDSKFFSKLPDRAFERVKSFIKVRAFERAEPILNFSQDKSFSRYFGYVVRGKVFFVDEADKPLGMAIQDEFFLGKAFSIEDREVRSLVSADSETLVVYVRKEIFEVLASIAPDFSELIQSIYNSIFERSKFIASDDKAGAAYQEWLSEGAGEEGLRQWIATIEKRQAQQEKKKREERAQKRRVFYFWIFSFVVFAWVSLETYAVANKLSWSLSFFLTGVHYEFNPGSRFNIALGIVGYVLLIMTNLHWVFKWGMKKFKWKFNFKLSSHLHILFGVLGAFFILYHTAFRIEGGNIAHYALYALFVSIISGFVGQVIASQIPKSIRGEKLRLDGLHAEQKKLQQQAELLMDDNQFKTSIALMAQPLPGGFWPNVLGVHRYWLRKFKVLRALKGLGLGAESAHLASQLLAKELRLKQMIRGLELSNQIFRRWMIIHKPIGYIVYVLGALHIFLVSVLT